MLGHAKAVKFLLGAGASQDVCDRSGRTPLHLCVSASQRICGYLVKALPLDSTLINTQDQVWQ